MTKYTPVDIDIRMILHTVQAEVAKEALAAARSYADAIILDPLKEFSGILTDTIGYWRLRNQVRLILKAKQWLEDKGVEPAKLLPEIFVPLIGCGGEKEDETLSDMFASLLASHLDPERQDAVHPSFPKVLSELSPLDAKILVGFRRLASAPQYRELGLRGAPMTVEMVAEQWHVSRQKAYLTCLNLERLGLLTLLGARPPENHPLPTIFEDSRDHQEFRISEFGIVFCDACSYEKIES